jgi:protein-tyrosine-phosphatase
MAAALMRAKPEGFVNVISGGTHPGERLSSEAQMALEELGLTMGDEHPKPITVETLLSVDQVIILGDDAQIEPSQEMRGTITRWVLPENPNKTATKIEQTRLDRDYISTLVNKLYDQLAQPE